MKNLLTVSVLVFVLVALAACGGSEEEAAEQASGQAASEQAAANGPVALMASELKANCSKCHSLDRVCGKIGKAGMPEWGATLGFMMSKGAAIGSASVAQAAEFLADEASARPALCE